MDLGPSVDAFVTGKYTVTRRGPTAYMGGVATPGAAATHEVEAFVHDVVGSQLMRLPEGMRARRPRAVYTRGDLRLKDVIAVDGDDCEVELVEEWRPNAGFLKAVALKVGP